MLFSKRLRDDDLVELCRSMRFSLKSGLMLRETMELIGTQGPRRLRPIAGKITAELKGGWQLQQALEKHKVAFPPVFMALVEVGEETGKLPEILGHLEEYYTRHQKLRREFVSQVSWPAFQFVVCVLVLAGLIYVLGVLQPSGESAGKPKPIEPLGFGLLGPRGAIIFLSVVFGTIFGLFLFFVLVRRTFRSWAPVEWLLLHIPLYGSCLMAMVMTRFCVALRLMLDANISILRTIRLALVATDNQLFINAIPRVEASLRKGNSIPTTLKSANVFPEPFLGVVAIADTAGQLPEALDIQAGEYDDQARRRLLFLNRLLSWAVWLLVAIAIAIAIFRIFYNAYYGRLMGEMDNMQ